MDLALTNCSSLHFLDRIRSIDVVGNLGNPLDVDNENGGEDEDNVVLNAACGASDSVIVRKQIDPSGSPILQCILFC